MMRIENPIQDFVMSVASIFRNHPKVYYTHTDPITRIQTERNREAGTRDIRQIYTWYQTFGSTALIFGGIGGAAMSDALMVVLETNTHFIVYCAGRFAFLVEREQATEKFKDELKNRHFKSMLREVEVDYCAIIDPSWKQIWNSKY